MTENGKDINGFSGVDRRNDEPGRRRFPIADRKKCLMHDELRELDKRCIDAIKKRSEAQDLRIDGFAEQFDKFVSKWVAKIITSVALAFLLIFVGAVFTSISKGRKEVKDQLVVVGDSIGKISVSVDEIHSKTDINTIKQATVAAVQRHVVETVGQIEEAQDEFRSDLQTIKFELRTTPMEMRCIDDRETTEQTGPKNQRGD